MQARRAGGRTVVERRHAAEHDRLQRPVEHHHERKGQTRTTTRNVFGKPKQAIDAGGYATSYDYGVFADLTRTVDAKGNQDRRQ